jgi:HEAT repeat protein
MHLSDVSTRVQDLVRSLLNSNTDQWDKVREQLVAMGPIIAPILVDEIKSYRRALRQFREDDKVFTSVLRTDAEFKRRDEERLRLSHIPGFLAEAVLGRLGAETIPCFITLIQDEDIYFEVEKALTKIGKPACRPVMTYLTHPEPRVRKSAVSILMWLEEGALEAAPPIIQLLNDSDPEVRQRAAKALAWIIGPASLPHLLPFQNDHDWKMRWSVCEGITSIAATLRDEDRYKTISLEEFAADVLPTLINGLADEKVHTPAAEALIYLAQTVNAKCAIDSLIAALRFDPDNESVCRALAGMMPDPIAPLLHALDHPDENIRKGAGCAFQFSTWAESKVDVPPLVSSHLRSKDSRERIQATKALKAMGTSSKDEVPELKRLLRDSDSAVSSAARDAIQEIERKD